MEELKDCGLYKGGRKNVSLNYDETSKQARRDKLRRDFYLGADAVIKRIKLKSLTEQGIAM
jgi:hypothetical protein